MKSASKSVISALIGIAIEQGYIDSVNEPIAQYFPEYISDQSNADKLNITIENLLTMQSGLETTSNRNYGKWVLSDNWVEFAINQPLVAEPGTRMLYSTGSAHLLSAIITRATELDTKSFAQQNLVSQLGYSMSYWSQDPQGVYFGGNDIKMTPRQMLVFGELYLNRGIYDGRQVISEQWIQLSHRPHARSPRGQGATMAGGSETWPACWCPSPGAMVVSLSSWSSPSTWLWSPLWIARLVAPTAVIWLVCTTWWNDRFYYK